MKQISFYKTKSVDLKKNPPLFKLKIVYSYLMKVADFDSDFGFYIKVSFGNIYILQPRTMHFVDQDVVVMNTLVGSKKNFLP